MISSRIKKLRTQVLEMKPEKIICLGKYASDTFSKKIWKRNDKPCIVKVTYKGIKFELIIAYHPSYVYNYQQISEEEYIQGLFKLMMR